MLPTIDDLGVVNPDVKPFGIFSSSKYQYDSILLNWTLSVKLSNLTTCSGLVIFAKLIKGVIVSVI